MDTPSTSQQRVTDLLTRWSNADDAAPAELTPLVDEELRRLAYRHMNTERTDHTLQTTALVDLYSPRQGSVECRMNSHAGNHVGRDQEGDPLR